MKRTFAEAYHAYCEAIEEFLQERLGRSLSEVERLSLWNTGSLLEAFERDLVNAPSAEAVVALLMQRVLTAEETLERIGEKVMEQVAGLLLRPLSYKEEQRLCSLRMVEEAMRLIETLNEAPADQRESVFQHALEKFGQEKDF